MFRFKIVQLSIYSFLLLQLQCVPFRSKVEDGELKKARISSKLSDYWKKTKFSAKLLKELLNGQECNKPTKVAACLDGIAHGYSLLDDENAYKVSLSPSKGSGSQLLGDFGGFRLYLEPKGQSHFASLSPLEKARLKNSQKIKNRKMIEKFFEDKSLPFDTLLSSLIDEIIIKKPDHKEFVFAAVYTRYLQVSEDPHTRILPLQYVKDQRKNSTDFVGIGVSYRVGDFGVLITRVIEGSPAEKAKLNQGDEIIKVDGASLKGMSSLGVSEMLAGSSGEKVTLTFLRGVHEKTAVITRAKFSINKFNVDSIPFESSRIIYLKLRDFRSDAFVSAFKKAIESGNRDINVKGFILDLRTNPGGNMVYASKLVNFFIPKDKLIHDYSMRPGYSDAIGILDSQVPRKTPKKHLTGKPLVVLGNANSASASEYTIGNLGGYGRAYFVGQRTYGKGTVQHQNIWVENSKISIKLTIAIYRLGYGGSPQRIGILPHFEVFRTNPPLNIEMHALREVDIYSNSVMFAENTPMPLRSNLKIAEVSSCVSEEKFSRMYNADGIMFWEDDLQILKALDVMNCAISKGVVFQVPE